MVEKVSLLNSLGLSYAELSGMGFEGTFVQDYLNQLQNILNLATVSGASIEEILALQLEIDGNTNAISEASGQLVGNTDFAILNVAGVVKRMQNVSDAIESTATITLSNISGAPALYSQSHSQKLVDMANSTKSRHNELKGDLNLAIIQLNKLLANLVTSGQMA